MPRTHRLAFEIDDTINRTLVTDRGPLRDCVVRRLRIATTIGTQVLTKQRQPGGCGPRNSWRV
jgi:hypothetical protein